MLMVPHRTQILYSPDISLIIYLMSLAPGSVVIETVNPHLQNCATQSKNVNRLNLRRSTSLERSSKTTPSTTTRRLEEKQRRPKRAATYSLRRWKTVWQKKGKFNAHRG